MVSYLGVPYVFSKFGGVLYPNSIKQPEKTSDDIIALIGASALSYIMNNGKCELSFSCDKGESTTPECKTIPWEGVECPITVFYKIINDRQ